MLFTFFPLLAFLLILGVISSSIEAQNIPGSSRRLGGTIRDIPGLNATADAIGLKGGMRGLGTNEQLVINIMTSRSINDRLKIAHAYKSMYTKDLGTKFKWEFSFHAKEMLEDLLVPLTDYDAQVIYSSMKGFGTDIDSITGVLCSKDSHQIQKIKDAYMAKYKKPLEKALQGDVSDPLLNLYLLLINSNRESGPVNPTEVEKDAREIMAADLKHFSNNNPLFKVLTGRSKEHIIQVLETYQRLSNNQLTKVLDQDLSGGITNQGKIVRTVKNLIQCTENPAKFYAQLIHNDISGGGTKDKRLFRTLIARSEIDLEDIKNEYKKLYNQDLSSRLERETSGTFQKLVKGILKGNREIFDMMPNFPRPGN